MCSPRKGIRAAILLVGGLLAAGCLEEGPQRPTSLPYVRTPSELTVLAPNGGEVWGLRRAYVISWRSQGGGDWVHVELFHDSAPCAVIADSTANDGIFVWSCDPCCADSAGFEVRVTDLDTGQFDQSDRPFAVAVLDVVCTIEVTEPHGDGEWYVGDSMAITWNARGRACGEEVMIELVQDHAPCLFVAEVTPNDGRFEWTVAACSPDPDGYRIRVTDLSSGSFDECDGELTILPAPPESCDVIVQVPNGGERWTAGEVYTLTWECDGACGEEVRIELIHRGEAFRTTIAERAPNSGTFEWIAERHQEISSGYQIQVTELETGSTDESDATFEIVPPVPLVLTSPNGGERWTEGTVHAITWESTAQTGPALDVDLVLDGVVCGAIATGAPNTGSFDWVAERCGDAESGYRVRITDPVTGAVDDSDAPFTIQQACALTLLTPNGGETWGVGQSQAILWESRGGCDDLVWIELLQSGQPCHTIAAGVANSGAHDWVAVQCALQTEDYRVRISQPSTGAEDTSDGAFAIVEGCKMAVLEPTLGDVWLEGAQAIIRWQRSGTCDDPVRIDLLHDGTACATISGATANSGSFTWIVDPCGGWTTGYRIRITDLGSGATAESHGTFAIQRACELRLQSPNGGETWIEGCERVIGWALTEACAPEVVVELLLDGVLAEMLAEGAPNSGSFAWIPSRVSGRSNGYAIRIRDPLGGAWDESSGPFSILEPCVLDVLAPDGGETWVAGGRAEIRWDASASCGQRVRIDLLSDGVVCRTVAASTPNDGAFSWAPQVCGGQADYRIAVTDLLSELADTSAAPFEIRSAVHLRVDFTGGGWTVRTNNPAWMEGRIDLEFDGQETAAIGCPDWFDYGCTVLVLDPDEDDEAGFFPTLAQGMFARRGLEVDAACRAVEVKVTGCGQEVLDALGLRVQTQGAEACQIALPLTTELRSMSAQFEQVCVRDALPLRLEIVFTDHHIWNRTYAVREVEYVFHGWPAPQP